MREIVRVPLSAETIDFLWERRLRVVEAGDRAAQPGDREGAQQEEAARLWRLKENKAFSEIRAALCTMAPGHEYCMYCEHSIGDAIDHFRPLSKYPTLAFSWDNYLWSCSICNSTYKAEQFPLDGRGLPLLIDPTRDHPRAHLAFSPHDGRLVGITPKGDKTVQVLGFDRRKNLDRTRAAAWRAVQRLVLDHDDACVKGDTTRAIEAQRDLCSHPHASLLAVLVELSTSRRGVACIDPRCAAAIADHPEMRSWV
jgi:uncharacterized protein (TIGR02646 family)